MQRRNSVSRYVAEPKSRNDLRQMALGFRRSLKLDNTPFFPVERVLEIMSFIFPKFNWCIVDDDKMPAQEHANTDVIACTINIKQSVYDRACSGAGRDRMTIAHEIGHYLLLCEYGVRFCRNYDNDNSKLYCDPKWQAKCFAGELLMPAHLVKDLAAEEIANTCGVSIDAAKYQYNVIHKGGV